MSLTRGYLKGMGLTEEQVNAVIEAHMESVNGLKEQITNLTNEVATAQKSAKENVDNSINAYKTKYEKEHSDFEEYKASQEKAKEHSSKKAVYEQLLKKAGISDKRIQQILAIAQVDELKLDEKGNVEGEEDIEKKIAEEWSEFIPKTATVGATVENPPANSGTRMTKDEIFKIKDTKKRQKAIEENIDLFK